MHKRILMIAMAVLLFASGVFGVINVVSPGAPGGNPDARTFSDPLAGP